MALIQFSPIKQTLSLENKEPSPALLLKPDFVETVLTLQEKPMLTLTNKTKINVLLRTDSCYNLHRLF